jgi:hypothetical protein
MRRIFLVLLVIAAAYYGISQQQKVSDLDAARSAARQAQVETGHRNSSGQGSVHEAPANRQTDSAESNDALMRAIEHRQHNVEVHASGTVEKVLKDDTNGSRHQRFLVSVGSGQTILIAHNIDLAPRVAPLLTGDRIEFSGEYEWNDRGGVVHWTHRDPGGRHKAGWIKHDGALFQ